VKKIIKFYLLIVLVFFFWGINNAVATVINFDDLEIGKHVPAGYGGLTWGFTYVDTANGNMGYWVTNDPDIPNYAIPHSTPIYVVNAWGGDQLYFRFSSPVFFIGAWFAAPNILTNATQVRFYDDLGHQSNWLDIDLNPQFLSANFSGATTVWVERRGGTPGDNGSLWFTMDDVTYNAVVPEPTTMLLLGSGLIGLAGYGRKKLFKK
jgi:hypothetical protein